MKQIINNIINFVNFKRKSKIKVFAMILLIGILFVHHTYAQGVEPNQSTLLNDTQKRLEAGVNFLSWIWIFVAIIAGKFMTNDVVYGSFMHLDAYLRSIRNIMKNFANFGLAAMILYSILQYIINKGKAESPQKIIIKALIAGVFIQISWFIVGALVDLSNVATSALAGFPSNYLKNSIVSTDISNELANIFAKPKYIAKIDEKGQLSRETPQDPEGGQFCSNTDIDVIMPKYDSVGGPLIFVGMSFFNIQKFVTFGPLSDNASGAGQMIINLAIKLIILLAYIICLVGLLIANIVRVLFLWLFIVASPIVVLLGVFNKKFEGKDSGSGRITKYLNIQTFLDLIFKPVFFIGFLGLMIIFISSVRQIMGDGKGIKDMSGINITSSTENNSTKIALTNVSEFTINENIFKDIADGTRNIFVDLILVFMTILLFRWMFKWSIEIGGGPVKEVMDKLTPMVESMAGNLPLIPMPGGEKFGLKNIIDASNESTKKILRSMGISEKGRFFEAEEKFQAMIDEKFLGKKPSWLTSHTKKLEKIIKDNPDDFRSSYIDIASKTNEGVTLSSPNQLKLVEKWFNKIKNDSNKMSKYFGDSATTKSFEKYFKESGRQIQIQKLHEHLGGNAALPLGQRNKALPTTYEEVKSNRYYYDPDK